MRHRKPILSKLGPKKGQPPKRGTNQPQIEIFCFPGGDTLKSCVQSKFEAETVENCSIYDRPHFLGPKIAPFP